MLADCSVFVFCSVNMGSSPNSSHLGFTEYVSHIALKLRGVNPVSFISIEAYPLRLILIAEAICV